MKIFGIFALLLGVILIAFAVLTFLELRAVATSDGAPPLDAMLLTKIVGPEMFDPGDASISPVTLGRIVMSRIYMIGVAGLLGVVLGIFVLVVRPTRSAVRHGTDASESPGPKNSA